MHHKENFLLILETFSSFLYFRGNILRFESPILTKLVSLESSFRVGYVGTYVWVTNYVETTLQNPLVEKDMLVMEAHVF